MANETDVRILQKRVWELKSELASQRRRNNIEGFRYVRMLMLRELIMWDWQWLFSYALSGK